MSLAEIIALQIELGRCRQDADGSFGRALQMLNRMEAEWRERERNERLTVSERQSMGASE
jgi:hypothetical protein